VKNKLTDLNDHLFAQMERLGEEDLKGDDLKNEIHRTKAIASVANNIINNARLAFDAKKAVSDNIIDVAPGMIGVESK